jgi:hypothetical protein
MLAENTISAAELDAVIAGGYVPPVETNPNLPRYGMMFLINLPLFRHTGNSALLDVNPRNEANEEIKNIMYFPKLALIPFKTFSVNIPPEREAERTASGDYNAHAKSFSPTLADGGNYITKITKTAEKCLSYAKTVYGQVGFQSFYSLVGVESYQEAKEIFYAVLPLNDTKIFPKSERFILGESFTSPFLDQILAYLQSVECRENLFDAKALYGDERIDKLYNEILTGARNANSIARQRIGDSERDMSAVPAQKIGYDMRSSLFNDGEEPMDLVCLAMLNEKPKNDREIDRARKINEQSQQPIQDFTQALGSFAQQMRGNPNPSAMTDD